MFLSKDGITVEAITAADVKRYKAAGYVEAAIAYPVPTIVVDGKPEEPAESQAVENPAEPNKVEELQEPLKTTSVAPKTKKKAGR